MGTKRDILFYITILLLFVLLKLWYSTSDNNDLFFLLKPTDKFIEIFTGSNSVYFSDRGFYHHSLNILIDKSCSGFNFLLISFCLFSFLYLNFEKNSIKRLFSICIALFFSFLFTIFVNSSRIYVSLTIHKFGDRFLTDRYNEIIHQVAGTLINLTFLILIYLISENILIKKSKNEKFT